MKTTTKLSKNENSAIQELKQNVLNQYGLLQMKIFGSKVRGDYDEHSDIDLLLVLREVNWQIEKAISELCFEIGLKHDVLLSPVILSDDDINDKLIQSTPFYRVIEKEGVIV